MAELIPKASVLLLILVRVSAFFVSIPLFSYRTIPPQLKIALAFILSWIMYYSLDVDAIPIDGNYILLVLKELIIGLMIGIAANIVFSAVQIAGGFIDFEMGFAMANIIDPQTGAQTPLMGQFFNFLLLFVLLATNGHHLILDGIFYSYEFLPMNQFFPMFGDADTVEFIIKLFGTVFAIAFQMSAPIVATLFLVTLALGITAKTVPQLNIFVIGFPVKIAIGFLVLIISMGVMIEVMEKLIELTILAMRDLMQLLGGA
ncbi:flagellar biosynthetic protein FliR [Lysinibacillus endophyticus]|uniref:Flagellar biosynthetic protein FliR n=1 Tax=Ureibacillus endophyticus TaxID=1978490 RepID=A0A494ZCG1_9BACL|nr:flagellar biosynthetic protein FliR [Lysinibacillus endophyticus]MCP1144059.1 flagellar type III secretion system protein FliR [Lysinibacillus endophyticus]RKQ19808.1 flagellar type III secretion system protein FliR [Lysinibacillus endophyticus]